MIAWSSANCRLGQSVFEQMTLGQYPDVFLLGCLFCSKSSQELSSCGANIHQLTFSGRACFRETMLTVVSLGRACRNYEFTDCRVAFVHRPEHLIDENIENSKAPPSPTWSNRKKKHCFSALLLLMLCPPGAKVTGRRTGCQPSRETGD